MYEFVRSQLLTRKTLRAIGAPIISFPSRTHAIRGDPANGPTQKNASLGQLRSLLTARLAFVAKTRARSALYITWAEHRKAQWGETKECQPSRFIGGMGL
jgi:hypothetical protein